MLNVLFFAGPETAMKESMGIVVSDEMIEKSIRSMNSFIAINILATKVETKSAAASSSSAAAADVAPVTPESASSTVRKSEVSAPVSRSRGKSGGKSRESKAESTNKKVLAELVSFPKIIIYTYIHTYIHTYMHTDT